MHATAGPRSRGRLAALLVLTLLVAACGGAAGPGDSRAVTFESSDGVRLAGRVFGDGSRAVILTHMRSADQRSWFDFADRLADQGYLVLAFDFRGTCPGGDGGCSEGETVVSDLWKDVVGAIRFLRSEEAVGRVALVGASVGGTASLVAAAQPGTDVSAVVTLSAPTEIEGLRVDGTMLSSITAGKLFVAGVGDAPAATAAQTLYEQAPPPKRVEIVPADDHGTDLLSGAQAEVVRRLIEVALETNRL